MTISYKIKFLRHARVMTTSLSSIVHNLRQELHKVKSKDCDCFLEYESAKDNLIKYKYLSSNKEY